MAVTNGRSNITLHYIVKIKPHRDTRGRLQPRAPRKIKTKVKNYKIEKKNNHIHDCGNKKYIYFKIREKHIF